MRVPPWLYYVMTHDFQGFENPNIRRRSIYISSDIKSNIFSYLNDTIFLYRQLPFAHRYTKSHAIMSRRKKYRGKYKHIKCTS